VFFHVFHDFGQKMAKNRCEFPNKRHFFWVIFCQKIDKNDEKSCFLGLGGAGNPKTRVLGFTGGGKGGEKGSKNVIFLMIFHDFS